MGETIWFRLHRVDASLHTPTLYSGVLYVDIVAPDGDLVRRMMITPIDSVFYGGYPIPLDTPSGWYEVVAYSNWQQNFDSDFYFRKSIFINNPRQPLVEEKPKVIKRGVDLQFMPEGGSLLAGITQRIAFKAVGEDGYGEDLSGVVRNQNDEIKGFIRSIHHGMGEFQIQVAASDRYHVVVDGNESQRYDLPEVEQSGVVVTANNMGDDVRIGVVAVGGVDFEGKSLLIHSRGVYLSSLPLSKNITFDLPKSRLPDGIIHLAVVDAVGNIYSQRLLFNDREVKQQPLSVESLNAEYGRRDKVDISLESGDVGGVYSLSVVDINTTKEGVNNSDIYTYMLLTSDIKGYVESPNEYFDTTVPKIQRERSLDLLMMTQGWSRFDLGDIIKGTKNDYKYSLQLSQGIAGRIKSLWNKNSKAGSVALVSTEPKIFKIIESDESGFFETTDLTFPENTTFVLQGLNEKNRKSIEVVIEDDGFKSYKRKTLSPNKDVEEKIEAEPMPDLNYYYADGVKNYYIDAVEVVASGQAADAVDEEYKRVSNTRITSDELIELGYTSIWDWLGGVPSIDADEATETISIRGGSDVGVVVDDVPYELDILSSISIDEVASLNVSYHNNSSTNIMSFHSDGVVMIRLKDGMNVSSPTKSTLSFFHIEPIGYYESPKFYVPKYSVRNNNPEVDERTTIHWQPDIKIDSTGVGRVSFYTADIPTKYKVAIEGVSSKGDIIREERIVEIK